MTTQAKFALVFALAAGYLLHQKMEEALTKPPVAKKVAESVGFNGRGPLDERVPVGVAIREFRGGMPVYQAPSRRRVNVLTTC